MSSFQYTGRDAAGGAVKGTIEAANPQAVAEELASQGVVPLRITGARESPDVLKSFEHWWDRRQLSLSDIIMFARQLHTLTRSGVPILGALRGLSETCRNPEMGRILEDVAAQVESGQGLAQAMSRHEEVFTPLFVSIVRVGENSGRMEEAVEQIYRYLELEENTRRQIKTAMRYPTMVLGAISIAIVIVNVFVIPPFAKLFDSFGSDLPWATRILITTSDITVHYWPFILVAIGGAVYFVNNTLKTKQGRMAWDRWKLRMPIVGSILRRAVLARFARMLSITLGAGLPVIQSLRVISGAVDNEFISSRIAGIQEAIQRGETLTRAARQSDLFTPLILQMLDVGEETGEVEGVLIDVADYYEREVEYDLARLGSAIEPIMIIAIGGIVLVLALGVYLPMWEMGQLARGG